MGEKNTCDKFAFVGIGYFFLYNRKSDTGKVKDIGKCRGLHEGS